MRFLYAMILGSAFTLSFCVATANTVLKPAVESYPEHVEEVRGRIAAEIKARRLADDLEHNKLLLDAYRRGTRDPVYPKGVDVAPQDKIAAPAVPLPTVPTP